MLYQAVLEQNIAYNYLFENKKAQDIDTAANLLGRSRWNNRFDP